ncbi:hypothetical protein FACS1894130_01660 [Spirochaetia bacterium]|nr:hypothetical protein FACS1894130_01660 [Spirochaetia bacterium]
MKIIKILFYFFGLIVSLAFITIGRLVGDSWLVIFIMISSMTAFCSLIYFALDKFVNKRKLEFIYWIYYIATLFALVICIAAFVKRDYLSASSQMIYIPFYLSFVIYTIYKGRKMEYTEE